MTQGMKFNTEAKALGFQDHDILVGTDKGEFKTYDGDMYRDLYSHPCGYHPWRQADELESAWRS